MPRRSETNDDDLLIRCPQCRGSGVIADLMDPTVLRPCSMCQGSGRVRRAGRERRKS